MKRIEYLEWISLRLEGKEGEAHHTIPFSFSVIEGASHKATVPHAVKAKLIFNAGGQAAHIYTMAANSKLYSMSNLNTHFH